MQVVRKMIDKEKVTALHIRHSREEAEMIADRVVVMKSGVVQQVGTPTDIYDNPANTFVASFIGSPAMNLMEGDIKNGTFTARNATISGLNAPDGPTILGFRAEDSAVAEGVAGQINGPLYTIELLGDAVMLTVRAGGQLVSVKAPKDFRAEIGDPVSFSVPATICHLFDTQTGGRQDR